MTREPFVARHLDLFVLGALVFITAILYSPALAANFMGDDFNYLRFLFFNADSLLNGEQWNVWLAPIFAAESWIHFRPLPPVFFLIDYLAWGFNPTGWHLSDFVLQILISFLVFLLTLRLTHERWMAVVACLLFAAMPIHVEAISWFAARADGLSAIWYLSAVLFFIAARTRRRSMLLAALAAFGLALSSKEAAMTLPVILAAYDLLYHRREMRNIGETLALHLPFWAMLLAYGVARFMWFGALGSYTLSRLPETNWIGRSQVYVAALADPFISDVSRELLALLVAVLLFALALYRSRREVWFGAIWLLITILPSYFSLDDTIFDRFVYLPSIGLAILIAGILMRPFALTERRTRVVGAIALGALVVVYATALYQRNETFARNTQITKLVPDQVLALQPSLPENARLFFTGFPIVVMPRGVQSFGWIVDRAMQIAYDNPRLQAISVDRFPLLVDKLDRTYFFEYNRRKLTERADLMHALERRNQCLRASQPALVWDFSKDAQGWEAWHDLGGWENREGMLTMRAMGNDPYMASPEMALSTTAIGDIEITMRVRADRPTVTGQVYWWAASQQDFAPDLNVAFPIQADGEWHTWRIDIAETGRLLLDDKIIRLRFDPTDTPADIAIKNITVYTHCDTLHDACPCGNK